MDKSLEHAFNEIGIKNPTQYVEETIERLNQIEAAVRREQEIMKRPTSIGMNTSRVVSEAKSHLEFLKK